MSTKTYPLGKFNQQELSKYVFPHIKDDSTLLSSPQAGSDFNALRLPKDLVLVASTDPLAISPQLGWKRSARLAFHVIASDVAVSGIPPNYLITNWNLPPSVSYKKFEEIWREFVAEADREEVAVVGGHTGRCEKGSFPIVGAGTVLGIGKRNKLLSGTMSSGDKLYLLNHLGLESVVIFALYFPDRIRKVLDPPSLDRLKRKFDSLRPTNTLNRLTKEFSYLKRVHDIAEGGLIGGAQELISGTNHGLVIEEKNVLIDPAIQQVCEHLHLDPRKITSIGSAIAVVPQHRANEFQSAISGLNLDLSPIGQITEENEVKLRSKNEVERVAQLDHDEFWTRLADYNRNHGQI